MYPSKKTLLIFHFRPIKHPVKAYLPHSKTHNSVKEKM